MYDTVSKTYIVTFVEEHTESKLSRLVALKKDWESILKTWTTYVKDTKDDIDGLKVESEEKPEKGFYELVLSSQLKTNSENVEFMTNLLNDKIEEIKSDTSTLQKNLSDLPDPDEIARIYVERPKNKSGVYTVEEISPVMTKAKEYIQNNSINDLYSHVKTVRRNCNGLKGSPNQQDTWIKFYAKKSNRYKLGGNYD